jgi:hypothetical protein
MSAKQIMCILDASQLLLVLEYFIFICAYSDTLYSEGYWLEESYTIKISTALKVVNWDHVRKKVSIYTFCLG